MTKNLHLCTQKSERKSSLEWGTICIKRFISVVWCEEEINDPAGTDLYVTVHLAGENMKGQRPNLALEKVKLRAYGCT